LHHVWRGRRNCVLDERAEVDDLAQHVSKIPGLMFRRVRVVVANPFPEVAMRLVETSAQNPRACLDIGAEIVAHGFVGIGDRRVPMRRDLWQPDLVHLDRADVHRPVCVRADAAERAAFHVEQDYQHGWRQPVDLGCSRDAAPNRRLVVRDVAGFGRSSRDDSEQGCGKHRTSHGAAPVPTRGESRVRRSIRSVAADHSALSSLTTIAHGPATCAVASIVASITVAKRPAPIPRSR
jgi:hypothetical protein